jgi:ankyrin repeat protein
MQRIIVWQSLDKFLHDNPDFDITGTITLNVSFDKWVRGIVERGIDGRVLLRVLKDRLIHIEEDHLLFAQKIANNELGTLIDKNGNSSKLLDFWLACEDGHKEDVEIYCNSGQNLEEEKIGRHSSEILTPLMLASENGHDEVVHILLEHGAKPNVINRRGRTALHLASYKGHEKTCSVLLGHNAQMFIGDIQGNTPLHFSVMGNHIQATNYLAFKGVDFVRNIVSDKVRPRSEATFDDVIEEVFYNLQDIKLHASEQRRFEKTWLSDAADLFIKLMDPNTRHMLPTVAVEVQDDVLMRFDPRPETGVFTKNNITGLQKFVPTVKAPMDLSVLLKNCFRQSSIDSLNSWKRTPLQIASEMNQLNSYEDIITILLDVHGCNSLTRDIHNNRAIDLLISDKNFALKPSATRLREEFLMKKSKKKFFFFFLNFFYINSFDFIL